MRSKIAEVPLGLLPINGSGVIRTFGIAEAFPPPARKRTPTLVLSAMVGINDRATTRKSFSLPQPRLGGTALSAAASPTSKSIWRSPHRKPAPTPTIPRRWRSNYWASTTYSGGAWPGVLRCEVIRTLAGPNRAARLPLNGARSGALPAQGHLTLMLREWSRRLRLPGISANYPVARRCGREAGTIPQETQATGEERPRAAHGLKAATPQRARRRFSMRPASRPATTARKITAVKGSTCSGPRHRRRPAVSGSGQIC